MATQTLDAPSASLAEGMVRVIQQSQRGAYLAQDGMTARERLLQDRRVVNGRSAEEAASAYSSLMRQGVIQERLDDGALIVREHHGRVGTCSRRDRSGKVPRYAPAYAGGRD